MSKLPDIGAIVLKSQKFNRALNCNKVEGLQGALKAFFIACLTKERNRIFVLASEPDELSEDIKVWLGNQEVQPQDAKVWCIPVWNEESEPPVEIKSEILSGLSVLLGWRDEEKSKVKSKKSKDIVVSALMGSLPLPDELRLNSVKLKVKSKKLCMNDLINKLNEIGFTRVGTLEDIGEFAVRGSLVDLWGYGMKYPVRVEWADDKIESIREFDLLIQTSIRNLPHSEEIAVLPINLKFGDISIMDYISDDALIVLDRGVSIKFQTPSRKSQIISLGDGYKVGSLSSYQGNIEVFRETIEKLSGYSVFVVCENETEKSRVLEIVNSVYELEITYRGSRVFKGEGVSSLPLKFDVRIGRLSSGFILPDDKVAVFTYSDIFGHKVKVRVRHPFKGRGIKIEDLTSLHPGDFVVHIDYGIGIYRGLKKLKVKSQRGSTSKSKVEDIETDYLFIEYKDGDKLYVPVDKFHLIEHWIGSYERPPELTLLDSGSWERKKSRAKKGIQDMTKELLSLYAERKLVGGYKFSPDTVWQAELESKFPYEETEAQLKVIDEVKCDMESKFPMDRLVCGEVGYGKTEVALRAAFKSVMDGKQVAFLCPTTILVEQHLRTFKSRLADFPIVVEHISRFRNRAEQKRVIESLRRGGVDIVIGTHRLLSKDIRFRELGLGIIDEEHKFGVAQKEKLRELKKNVDTLSLTATPIPRTLYMALTKIKDISELDTPPQGRQPIVTQMSLWDDNLIERAILYEIERGGQVYFVHNRIGSIEAIASRIRRMSPNFNVGVAHAELPERELEEVMLRFLSGDINVLVTTAIIGSGIDIPSVNTIIINRADRFGLAELHQLRGRVGRSDKRAYCYLFVSRKLTPDARKRLQAVVTHTELGAGFKLALRDLEIRGAGNLLGREQHGHIHAVGYELYMKLLEEEIKKMKGEKLIEHIEPEIRLGVSCYIPDWYADPEHKISLYKRLASCVTLTQVNEFEQELIDRFGAPPEPAKFLLLGAQIKVFARERGIIKIQSVKLKVKGSRGKEEFLDEVKVGVVPIYRNYELVFIELPKKLWFSNKYIEYVKPVNEGVAVCVRVNGNGIEELKDLLQRGGE